ncbi:Ankrd17 [Symbiodinium sp. CCMP2456]|nr:Ankrd17 [Symbiodinium sp. CCMP2456]
MFPENPLDLDSTWQVLLVPKARSLFGQTVYLCRPPFRHGEGEDGAQKRPCVAKMTFEQLPFRLVGLFGHWDPASETLRSVPHRLVFGLELLLLTGVVLVSGKALLPLLRLGYLGIMAPSDAQDSSQHLERLLQQKLPKSYKLACHLEVYQDTSQKYFSTVLDSGEEVTVQQMKLSEGNIRADMAKTLIGWAKRVFFGRKFEAIWGELKEPVGWVLLYDSAENWKGVFEDDHPPYRANRELMVPVAAFLRRQLVLATGHASVQWLILDELAGVLPLSMLMTLAFGFFCMHILVLKQAEFTVKWGLCCDQVLERQRQRLRPPDADHIMYGFGAVAAVMASALCCAAWSATALAPCLGLVAAVLVHAWDLKTSLNGLSKWREPELTSEFTEYPGERLPTSDSAPPSKLTTSREAHFLVISCLTWTMATAGISVLIFMGLDALQMRGTLTEYSFNKGHLEYLPGATALQNTLLLHEDSDSVTFVFEAGQHAQSVSLKLEHPQMDLKDSAEVLLFSRRLQEGRAAVNNTTGPAVAAGEYQINLPAGPLYSRITVEVVGKLQLRPTRYTFHLLRVGEALSLSLNGQVAESSGQAHPFEETRRWLYQERNADWYIADPDSASNWTLSVEFGPVCFAPLQTSTAASGGHHITRYADKCNCGDEQPGVGTECLKEEKIKLQNSTSICLYSQKTRAELRVDESRGRLSSKGLVKWLQDVRISGRFAGLRIDSVDRDPKEEPDPDMQPAEWSLPAVNSSQSQISKVFAISMRPQLLMQSTQIVVATTPDDTDAEEQALPLRILAHPPPITLTADSGFLLPEFSLRNRRSVYAACTSKLESVHGSIFDKRFDIKERTVELGHDCSGHAVIQKRFWAERDRSCKYWNRYQPWNENYDVAVTLSPEHCLNEAVYFGSIATLQELRDWSEAMATKQKSCAVVQRAVRFDRPDMVKELLKFWSPNCAGCKETPLGVAASEGNREVLELLLKDPRLKVDEMDAEGATALFRASRQCNVDIAARLIRANSSVNPSMPPEQDSECLVTPLLWLAGNGCQGKTDDEILLGSLFKILFRAGASLVVPGHEDCEKQTALVQAIDHGSLAAVPFLLDLKADPNEQGRTSMDTLSTPLMALFHRFLLTSITWTNVAETATLLLSKRADVNKKAGYFETTVLTEAAKKCQPDVVKFLLEKGAQPDMQDKQGNTAESYVESPVDQRCIDNKTARHETLRLLQQASSKL